MLYRLKTYVSKNKTIRKILNSVLRRNEADQPDIKHQLISKYVCSKTFIDVGCMWGVNGYFSFLAEQLGAKSVVAFDIFEATNEFKKYQNDNNSKVQFTQGDINSKECTDKLGKFDVVYCTGLLYHVQDPLSTLSRLRGICNDVLILGTAVIPELNGIDNGAVYYPYLNKSQREIWNIHQGGQLGISEPFDPKQGYGNWLWGFSSTCLESMVRSSGFTVIERHFGKFYSFVVCKLSTEPFLAVSGDWSNPDFSENVSKFKL